MPPQISGFERLVWLGQSAGSSLWQAARSVDGVPVLLKCLAGDPTEAREAAFLREFSLLSSLEAPGLVRPFSYLSGSSQPVMVLAPFPGRSLQPVPHRSTVATWSDASFCLRVGCGVAGALEVLHAAGLVHRDIRPLNILATADGETRLSDCSRAALEGAGGSSAEEMHEGEVVDWAYLSPEMTGRMNRKVDWRTDLYSLGVLLFRIATGRLPFQARDPLQWAHAHLALPPPPLATLESSVPRILSDIVMKLLAKQPEERYQSARGLRLDLERCLSAMHEGGTAPSFPLASEDFPARLHLSGRLHGREGERVRLMTAFEKVAETGGFQFLLVSGQAGAGKSALVQELRGRVTPRDATLVTGTFEELRQQIPYATLGQAFEEPIRAILSGSKGELDGWRQRLTNSLAGEGQVLVDVMPRLALILGRQPPLPEIPPLDAPKRFSRVFRRLLTAFATKDRPLVIFLDDLQWADVASLLLLESVIVEPGGSTLLLIGAYRDNETPPHHPLQVMRERLRGRGVTCEEIALGPLSQEEVGLLLMDALRSPANEDIAALAALVLRKTAGNPFFILQFVGMLHREGLIAFDHPSSRWRWDLPRIEGQGFTNNVLDLLAASLARLPSDAANLLALMACLGNSVEIAILARVWNGPAESMHRMIEHAVREGLVVRSGDVVRFLHDRVREAAEALVPDAHRADEHLRLARLLKAAWSSAEDKEEHAFEIVSQFNRGASLVRSADERIDIARLNLVAGKKAKTSAAYASAASYLAAGAALVPANAWESHYELAFSLRLHWAECAYLSGDLAGAKAQLIELLDRARTKADQTTVYRVLINTYLTAGERDTAWNLLLEGLARYGMVLPARPTREDVLREYDEMKRALGDTAIEDLLRRPAMEDPAMRAAMDLLALLPMPQMTKDPNVAFLACARIIVLSLRHGNAPGSAKGYSMFGVEMLGFVSDHRMAHRFAKLGDDLARRNGYVAQLPATRLAVAAVSFWIRPLAETKAVAASCQEDSLEVDDMHIACVAGHYLTVLELLEGRSLEKTLQVLQKQLAFMRKVNNKRITETIQNLELCVLKLMRHLPASSATTGRTASESDVATSAPDHGDAIFDIYSLMTDTIMGDHSAAISADGRALGGIRFRVGKADYFAFQFFRALAAAAAYSSAGAEARSSFRQTIDASRDVLKIWAECCPATFQAPYCLVSAERARIAGDLSEAARLCEEALRSAREHGFFHYQALAHELGAGVYRSQGLDRIAHSELRAARACYVRWGAFGKVSRLDANFPGLADVSSDPWDPSLDGGGDRGAAAGGHNLDFSAVLKASQAISGEIVLDRLLATLMRVLLEGSGAQGGFLVLVRDGRLHLAAEATVDGTNVRVDVHREEDSSVLLPASILNYVQRTGEKVLLDGDATASGPFSGDPFLLSRRPKSVLCFPIPRRSGPVALIYLDNNLVSHAFTPNGLATLELLASQAAISLENAVLYEDLHHENADRKRAEADLRGSQQLLQNIIDSSSAVICVKDLNGAFILVNRVFERIFKVRTGGVIGKTDFDIFPEARAEALRVADGTVVETGISISSQDDLDQEDGRHSYVSVKSPLFDPAGRIFAVCCISTDITESKQIEEQLRQSQKMEAVGHLAGGIAHDFNNLLTAINGYCWLALREVSQTDPLAEHLSEIKKAGERAATLTRQLLAYSRKQVLEPRLWDLNLIVCDMEKMLRRLISEDIILETRLSPETGRIKVDRGQVEQILLNMVVNARDAMPGGGHLTVGTSQMRSCCVDGASRNGRSGIVHVMLEVIDTGTGMTPEVQSKIFEPYFTTKGPGNGTGLGLSVVYGIVKQSGGSLDFFSEPGKGTTFRIFFPEASEGDAIVGGNAPDVVPVEGDRGAGTILLVEDDSSVRVFIAKVLEEQGYAVVSGGNGREALRTLDRYGARIRLVITDVIMPEMGGLALSDAIKQKVPDLPLLFVSGYTESPGWTSLMETDGRAFLQKPFSPSTLLEKVQRLLREKSRRDTAI